MKLSGSTILFLLVSSATASSTGAGGSTDELPPGTTIVEIVNGEALYDNNNIGSPKIIDISDSADIAPGEGGSRNRNLRGNDENNNSSNRQLGYVSVDLCEHLGCSSSNGKLISIYTSRDRNVPDAGDIGWNDKLTEVRTGPKAVVELWENVDYTGRPVVIGSYSSSLTVDLRDHDFNDKMTSYKIREMPNNRKVKLCSNKNFNCSGGNLYEAAVGSYRSMPSAIGNDSVSSFLIPAGYTLYIYEHSDMKGWRWKVTTGSDDSWMSLTDTYRNKISSFAVTIA